MSPDAKFSQAWNARLAASRTERAVADRAEALAYVTFMTWHPGWVVCRRRTAHQEGGA